jgi:hypothetical protein
MTLLTVLSPLLLIFIFGFCILLLVLSRSLEVSPFATTFWHVHSYIFAAATCFGPCCSSSGGMYNYCWKLLHLLLIYVHLSEKSIEEQTSYIVRRHLQTRHFVQIDDFPFCHRSHLLTPRCPEKKATEVNLLLFLASASCCAYYQGY